MSPSLRVCKEIANGSKHKTSRGNIEAKLEWGRAQIRLGKIKVGERTMSYPYELFVLDENGSTQLMEVFVKAAKFWRNELVRLGFLEPELIG